MSLSYALHLKLHIHFSRLRTGFDPRVVYVGFMAGKVVLRQVSLRALWFPSLSIIPPIIHTHNHLSAPYFVHFTQWPRLQLQHYVQEWCVRCLSQRFLYHLNTRKISTTVFIIWDTTSVLWKVLGLTMKKRIYNFKIIFIFQHNLP